MKPKYFEGLRAVQDQDERSGVDPMGPFDFQVLAAKTFGEKISAWLLRKLMPPAFALARRFFPVFKFNGIYWITRKADVIEALANWQALGVPYGLEMKELSRGADGSEADFLLGRDGPDHDHQRAIIEQVLLPGDAARIQAQSAAFSKALFDGGAGRLDIIQDFALRVPTEICRRYFGLTFADPYRFAEWAMSVSAVLFADPFGSPVKRRLAQAGAARLCRVIDAAIARAKLRLSQPMPLTPPSFEELSVVERLVWLSGAHPTLRPTDAEIRSIVLGLVVGFIPTNGLAAANMIEVIFGGAETLEAARAAARKATSDGGAAMRQVVLETGRRNPALSPGQWRYATQDVVIADGRPYRKVIPEGATVMVATMSALRDTTPPPNGWVPSAGAAGAASDFALLFGDGVHSCMGARLALTIISQMFVEMFSRQDLRAQGALKRTGYFPQTLSVSYRSERQKQEMLLIAVPVAQRVTREAVEAALQALGNPASDRIAQTLEATGHVHFASGSAVSLGPGETGPLRLLLEFNVDGDGDEAIDRLALHARTWLGDLIKCALPDDDRPLATVLKAHRVKLHFRPWGATGLNFFGVEGHSVQAIASQQKLRRAVEARLKTFLGRGDETADGLGDRAMVVLNAVRRLLRDDLSMDALLVQPGGRALPISTWRKPKTFFAPLKSVLWSGFGLKLAAIALVSLIGFTITAHQALGSGAGHPVPHWTISVVLGLLAAAVFWTALGGFAYRIFLWVEAREKPDDRAPDPARLDAIVAHENAPLYRQNHIIAVTPIKRGIVRRLALAFALWGIRQSLFWFRPGFVVTMGTIHFAKWFRLPGSNKMIFQSNYDGSWESYLEDFITRAHAGQTAAWSNGEGFPKSRKMILDGASDGDRFKRWVRRQQIPTAFWYSRFPDVTAEETRANAIIHRGLAVAQDDASARSWLNLFGAAQQQPYELESAEIQSLIFRGLKRALFTACIPFALPDERKSQNEWLQGLLVELSFGQYPQGDAATYLAFSAVGLGKFEGQDHKGLDIASIFPGAFTAGMATRGSILGDGSPGDPQEPWAWSDAATTDMPPGLVADGVMLVYAPTRDALNKKVENLRDTLCGFGGMLVHQPILMTTLDETGQIVTTPHLSTKGSYEHFGFRDGISAPVIRGNEQFTPHADIRDIVEPGEFVLGYANNQKYFAPSVMVPAESDPGEALSVAAEDRAFGFADFKEADAQFSPRDFGRNGSYLAIRQLRQDVEGFWNSAAAGAVTLNKNYSPQALQRTVGDVVTPEWLAAKLMGRWKDGRPLVGNPTAKNAFKDRVPDNGFAFGRDDPRGLSCPLGAHIRRANPRDSLQPDDPIEQMITRRHALIRRGRSYFYDHGAGEYATQSPGPDVERGLLFVALCADLERQFELVQQTWLGSPAFHGLGNEPDPISTRARHDVGERNFTIPTASGPLVVPDMKSFISLRGGGYFFMPSRSALQYLCNFSKPWAPPFIPAAAISPI